MEKRAAARTRV